MHRGGGALGALTWGLRKYAWLIGLFVLAAGVLLPVLQARTAPVYEASALVAPVRLTAPSVDTVPRYGEAVFGNGEVADAVRAELGLGAGAAVIPQHAELVSAQDNPSFTIIGRASDGAEAVRLADLAAATFTREMNSTTVESVGTFSIQSTGNRPSDPVPSLAGGRFALVIGVLAGLLAGIGVVGLLLLLRRPVLDAENAAAITSTPVLGKVQVPRVQGHVDERDVVGLAPLSRRLLASNATVIMVVSPVDGAPQRTQLTSALAAVLGRVRPLRLVTAGHETGATESHRPEAQGDLHGPDLADTSRGRSRDQLVLVDGPGPDVLATRIDGTLIVVVVPEGISERGLREAADEYLDGRTKAGVVLVSRGRRGRKLTSDSTSSSTERASVRPVSRSDAAEAGEHDDWFLDQDPSTDHRDQPPASANNGASRSGASTRR